jgi:predicted phage terminase large subunit-like protein
MNDFSLDPKFAKLTPASFAMYCSGGRWKLARHLALLNRELMNIATGKTKRLMVSMPPRPQPVDTNILMANGRYKPLANIQVGDEVISHKGIKRKVLNVIDAGVQPIITINTSTNIKIKLAESHRVGVEDQGWKEANKIEPGDRLVSLYNIKLENPVSLEPKLAYVLGIFCSLGIRRKGGVSSVCRDYKVMDKYRSEYFYTNEKGTLIFLTKAGEEALRSIGWTEPKRFPSIAWNLDDDTFIPFITGFLITENKPTNILRRDLPVGHLEDASKLLLNYGILSCCSYTNRGSILNIFKKPTVQYIKDIFAQKILTRQNDGPRYISHKITAIESTPPEPCICLEVEEDHSYIADTYVSHNSGKCVAEDQEVFRCDGKAIPIKDIKVGDKVFSVGESNKLHQDTVLHKVESGRKKCCRVTTKNGKSLISSLDHKYLTTRGYTRLEDIKPDEFIAYLDGDKVRWSKVIKLDKLGLRTTYDLQIQDYNNFIANGLVVHNSELVSKYFPAWYLGTFPDKQLIFSTYQAEFAAEFGAAARDLLAEYGEQVFGLNVREGSASASRWRIEDRLGIMQCAGVGGPLTGKGADCICEGFPISTNIGPINIENLVEMENKPLVLSYNHDTNKLEYKKILATRKTKSNDIYTIETSSGSTIRSTGKHRFFTQERGYQPANLLRIGDTLSEKISKKQNVCQLSQRENWQGNYLQRVLCKNKKNNNVSRMRTMFRSICKTFMRIRETVKTKTTSGILLFPVLFKKASFFQECKKVRELSNSYARKEKQQVLLSRMYKKSVVGEKIGKNSGCLQLVVQKNASSYIGERQSQMCSMSQPGSIYVSERSSREANISLESLYTSSGREQRKQHSRESFKYMYKLSSNTSQLKRETITRITKNSEESVPVYDIQVEGNSNFFANGILAHNCLIIDDPIKNDQEAESLVMRNKIFNWFGATAYTRLMPGGSVIIVMTRWHCLLPGTKVLSSKGYINIEDIIEQQEVYGTKGYSKVTGIANKEVKNTCYAFKLFANPDELNVTEDHQIYTNNGWKKAKDITINDKVFCPKPVKKYNNLDFIDFDKQALQDPDFWYCIGLWVAEGSLTYGRKTSSHNSVRYSLHKKEEDIILFVKKTLNKYNINLNYRILKNSLQAKCTDYKFARLVEKFGRGALNKIIPEFVYSLNEECLIQFLKGIYTGDGCLHDRYLRISSSSLSLLQGIRQCLLIIDSPSSIMYTRKNKKIGKAWEIRTVCDKICKVANPINFKSIQVLDTGCYFKIKNIKCFSYEGPVYDIKTESSDFVAEGCLVHNCDDLIGRLLDKVQQEQGEEWKYIKLSAIATEDEPEPPLALGRKRGEALWPEMWPIEKLNSIKNSGAISSYYWSALYQQEPAPEGGGIFKKSSFRYFTQQGDYYILELPNGERKYVEDNKCKKIITVDTANKVTNTSDYTAIGVWAITPDGDILLTHLVRDRIGYADILNKLIYLNSYYRPQFIGIENMGIAIQLITEARLKNLPVKALEPEGKGKQNRANLPMGAVIRMENGKIYFPKHASYLEDIELELLTFPKGKSDEIVDILSYLCNELTKVDMFDNSDFMPYSLEQGLPSGMRKNHGFSF